jgi:hypothetical protein
VHDSQALDALLTKGNTSTDVFADSAYRSAETEAKLSDTIIGFQQGVDKLIFSNTYYALVGHQGFDANLVYYNNDVGGTDWDSDVRVYDRYLTPVQLTPDDILLV